MGQKILMILYEVKQTGRQFKTIQQLDRFSGYSSALTSFNLNSVSLSNGS